MSSSGMDTFKKIMYTICASVSSTICYVFICAYAVIYFIAAPICNFTILQGALVVLPIILEIAGIGIAFTGVGLPITGVLIVISTALEVISSVCDIITGQWLSVFLAVLGWIPLVGVVPQIFRGLWKLIT